MIRGFNFGLGGVSFGGGWADFGALADEGDEAGEFAVEGADVVLAVGGVGLGLGGAFDDFGLEVGEFALEGAQVLGEVVGEEGFEGVGLPAVDGDEGDEVFVFGAEGEVDGAVFVHFEVYVGEEFFAEPGVEGFLGDGAAVGGPGGMEGGAGGVGEAVGGVGVAGGVGGEVEDGVGEWGGGRMGSGGEGGIVLGLRCRGGL